MRRFSAEYLNETRRDMWTDSRAALAPLDLPSRSRVIDVGAGTGELTAVLREDSPGPVIACDADRSLVADVDAPVVLGDAERLPFAANVADLVVCQALLVNLGDPDAAIAEFARVSSDLVAAIEPDNSAVELTSTVEAEAPLSRRARSLYLAGVSTDATIGAVDERFPNAGLGAITVRRYDFVRTIEPPYSPADIEAARRRATGIGLEADRAQILASTASPEVYDELRADWRAMGRAVVEQMQADEYYRREVVPFYVTVGRVEG